MDHQPNQLALQLFEIAIADRDALEIKLDSKAGSRILDFAVGREGHLDAGILLGRICMGGLAQIEVRDADDLLGLRSVEVSTDEPLLSCIGSQYAGWPISSGDYFAMGSGPLRMLRGEEEILAAYGLAAPPQQAVGVLESNQSKYLPTNGSFKTKGTRVYFGNKIHHHSRIQIDLKRDSL